MNSKLIEYYKVIRMIACSLSELLVSGTQFFRVEPIQQKAKFTSEAYVLSVT